MWCSLLWSTLEHQCKESWEQNKCLRNSSEFPLHPISQQPHCSLILSNISHKGSGISPCWMCLDLMASTVQQIWKQIWLYSEDAPPRGDFSCKAGSPREGFFPNILRDRKLSLPPWQISMGAKGGEWGEGCDVWRDPSMILIHLHSNHRTRVYLTSCEPQGWI